MLENYDARFSWPGTFSLGAVLAGFTGVNTVDFLRWAPLVFELLYLPPLLVIARCSGVGVRAGWLGVALFYATNWIDQDYFSPQALNYLLYLVVLATVLACWQPVGPVDTGGSGGGLQSRFAAAACRIDPPSLGRPRRHLHVDQQQIPCPVRALVPAQPGHCVQPPAHAVRPRPGPHRLPACSTPR